MASILHIKSEVECHVYLFDEDKGIVTPGKYFNLEVRKGKQDLLFVSTKDETVRCRLFYEVEEHDTDYSVTVERTQFKQYAQEILDKLCLAEQGDADAQCDLGRCYDNGKDVEQDYGKAVEWYRKAAEQGYPLAQSNLEKLRNEKIDKTAKTPYYLFFDTETTGVLRDYKAPASNTNNWPRLVQLGWILSDEHGTTISSGCEIVKPDGFVIPADATRVHGITTQKATREGKPLRDVIDSFLKDARRSKIVVGHNISFDQHIVGAELFRLGITDSISTAKSICTMEIGTDFCKIPGYYGYKWPKLQELYRKLFGTSFEDAHDAMADIKATKKCFFEMKRLGIVK